MSPLDLPLELTHFADHAALTADRRTATLRQLSARILATTAPAKSQLPWLKLATFGDVKTAKGSLRHNANVLTVTGIEADYDRAAVTMGQAAALLRAAGIAALIYTSPSHMEDLPRWRVLCPLSTPHAPAARAEFVAKLNGVLGGILATESFTLSQAYYLGHLDDADDFGAVLIEGEPLDQVPGLDPVFPARGTAAPLVLPALPSDATPDERSVSALRAAVGSFDESGSELGRHQQLLAATNAVAPFILSGHLDAEEAHDALESAMSESGRDANPGEIAGALSGAMRHAKPYEPPTHGAEFEALPPAPPAPVDPDGWRNMLQMTDKGTPTPTLTNAALALSHAPMWRGVFRLDTFAGRVVMSAAPPWHAGPFAAAEVTDADISQVAIWMQDNGIRITSALAFEAINVAARRDQFHPVRDYLGGLAWDGVPRLDTWLIEHLGAEDTGLTRAISARFVISMVARVSKPGCKVDTVLILEGRQGLRKSSALSTLARGWFTDHMPDLSSKDAALQIQGVVLVEFAELDKLHRAEAARAKAFISTGTDRLRRPYGKTTEDFPRQCVFAATVNPGSTGYLEDETGNRRFWPVACGVEWPDHRQVDLPALRGVVDQLWAEARSRYMAGAAWWLDADDLDDAQINVAVQRVTSDVWEPQIAQYVATLNETSVSEVLDQCIRKPVERRTKADMMRVSAVVRGLGWDKRRVSMGDGAREWRYFRTSGVVQLNRINAESLSAIF